jgi:inorganic pyrophosphatase
MVVDRFLYTTMFYPCNYGFIPHTLAEDGDPVDVLVLGRMAVLPGAVLPARPIGVLRMRDEAGPDEKVLAVPLSRITRLWERVQTYATWPRSTCSGSPISSRTTRISSPTSGSSSRAGASRRKRIG